MKIAFLFSGQGAQFPGMMKDLYNSELAAKSVFEAADRALGRGISTLCFEGSQQELNLTRNTQPCVLAADLAAGMVLRAHDVEPDAAAGFSLGEYAAPWGISKRVQETSAASAQPKARIIAAVISI